VCIGFLIMHPPHNVFRAKVPSNFSPVKVAVFNSR
jgi:hypothetical protein